MMIKWKIISMAVTGLILIYLVRKLTKKRQDAWILDKKEPFVSNNQKGGKN